MTKPIRKTTKAAPKAKAAKSPRRAAPAGKKGLDRTLVLQAARDLSDESGVGGLSIKSLAERLGIQPPSVYAHYAGLADLRRDLALWGHRELAQALRHAVIGLSGPPALIAAGQAFLAFIRQSPGLYSATITTPSPADVALRETADEGIEVLRRLLASMSLSEADQIHALRGLRSIVHGFGLLEAAGAFQTRLNRDESFARVLQTFVDAVSAQGQAPKARPKVKPGRRAN